jgi:hypothetical protein
VTYWIRVIHGTVERHEIVFERIVEADDQESAIQSALAASSPSAWVEERVAAQYQRTATVLVRMGNGDVQTIRGRALRR